MMFKNWNMHVTDVNIDVHDDDVFDDDPSFIVLTETKFSYLFLQKQKIEAELHIYLEEGISGM
jgi:hypothetical protein